MYETFNLIYICLNLYSCADIDCNFS